MVMALPFLPHHEIEPIFNRIRQQATTEPLCKFVDYVDATWISSNTWPPSSWSVYLQSIRTNNDVEGWHNALNRRARGKSQLPLYMLIELLHQEARLTSLQIRLVSERKLRRIQRKVYRNVQAKIFALWDDYQTGKKSAYQLLKACKYLNGPLVR